MLRVLILLCAMIFANTAYAEEVPELLEEHYLCNALLEVGRLDSTTALRCSLIYQAMKLKFINMSLMEFNALPLNDKAEANKRAYAAYVKWTEDNRDLATSLGAAMRSMVQ